MCPRQCGQGWGGPLQGIPVPTLSPWTWALSQLPQLLRSGSLFLTLPGTGLLDQVLPMGLTGDLDEPALVDLGQHLLHGS